MSLVELEVLADEIRAVILDTVSQSGGHLASNLGLVETTLMLHKLFDVPEDKLIFDVGHQCYTHKLLTGRYEAFGTLRKKDGISGFPNRFESPCDPLTAGHSGASVSASLGIATAFKMTGNDHFAVAVVGDGSFTNGMIYEALNNCNNKDIRLIILLNDNEMSISPNVGSLARYLSRFRTSGRYYRFKRRFQKVFGKIPVIGKGTIAFCRRIKDALKRAFYKQPFFEALGVRYYGPVDGNDLERLQIVLEEAKRDGKCCLVHVKTVKGKGYAPAEQTPSLYHSVGAFDKASGISGFSGDDFSACFGRLMEQNAAKDDRLCVITAAMCDGTGLTGFAESHPERFFDVGIAEEHAVTFSGGLALSGYHPVCALYSTFSQRVYDQLIHDISLQKLPLVLAIDRAGFVPGDGETHQGIFDCAFLSTIPGTVIYAPDSYEEMDRTFSLALSGDGITAVRYAKGSPRDYERRAFSDHGDYSVYCAGAENGAPTVALLTYGRLTANAFAAANALAKRGLSVRLIKLLRVFPYAEKKRDALLREFDGIRDVFFFEEGIRAGGIAEKTGLMLAEAGLSVRYHITAVDGIFPRHATVEQLEHEFGLDEAGMTETVLSAVSELLHK